MATARPFAYNTGTGITGTTQVGSLAVGTPIYGFPINPRFWNGPNEDLGYVIAHPVPSGTQPTPVPGVSASLGFNRTVDFTDESFISLANYVAYTYGGTAANFGSAVLASTWLTANGFWNSYVSAVLYLDAGNPSSYPGTGTTWTDIIGGKQFNLINGPTYDSGNGGKIRFIAGSQQYAKCNTSLSTLDTWSVGVWHYYTGQNTGASPCIVTEVFPGLTNKINYIIGNGSDTSPDLQTGFFNSGWWVTANGYTLTPNNWYYIVGTYDGPTLKLYVNNTLINTTYYDEPPIPLSSQGGIYLMSRWDSVPNQLWDGYLATVQIYNKALNSGQIAGIWNATKNRFGYGGFTLSSSDFTHYNYGSFVSPLGNSGFTTTGQGGPGWALYEPILNLDYGGNPTKLAEIRAFWAANGLNPNTNAYMFNVTWGAGSTLSSGVVIIEFVYSNDNSTYLNIGVVDTSDPIWQTSGTGYFNGPIYTLAGTWNFPATFTLITPLIVNGQDWC